jgi:hypothetical protein
MHLQIGGVIAQALENRMHSGRGSVGRPEIQRLATAQQCELMSRVRRDADRLFYMDEKSR